MAFVGARCPEFHVIQLAADGTRMERVSLTEAVRGAPAVIHFYNSG